MSVRVILHQIVRRVTPGVNIEHELQLTLHFTRNPDRKTRREILESCVEKFNVLNRSS